MESGKTTPYFPTVTDMKFVSVVAALAAPLAASATNITWSSGFVLDDGGLATWVYSCGLGPDGLLANGYKTLKEVPTFPYIGGHPEIKFDRESLYCGSPRFTKFDFSTDVSQNHRYLLEYHI